jgi:uncharacterized protein involved in exopolysaccharide biosynthesis
LAKTETTTLSTSMTEFFTVSKRASKSSKVWVSWLPYLILGLAGNAGMWCLSLFYLKVTPPIYTSNWVLSLPGTVSNTNISLPDTGNASSQEVSPYANTAQDPRENYKFIATSDAVKKVASHQLNIPLNKFGQPRIKIIDNTTLMSFELSGSSPEEAQKKALAYYKAFQGRLSELRAKEAAQREAKFQGKLIEAQKNLERAQSRLSDYQFSSGFTSPAQIEKLSETIEKLRQQRAETIAQQQQNSARFKQLSDTLDVTTARASDAFILKADQLFQQYLKDYNEATAKLVLLNSKYLPDNPAIVQAKIELDSVKTALVNRSISLLGRPINPANLAQLINVQSDSAREPLFKELFTSQVEKQGFKASAQEIDQQIALLEKRLKTLSRSSSTVEALKRDLQISEALFSTTLASLDVRNSDVFGSYPEVQLVTEPSFPDTPSSPKKKLVLIGTALGSLLLSTGLFLKLLSSNRTDTKKKN